MVVFAFDYYFCDGDGGGGGGGEKSLVGDGR
jgi:hypothetical protein